MRYNEGRVGLSQCGKVRTEIPCPVQGIVCPVRGRRYHVSSSSYTVQFKVIRSSSRKTVQFGVHGPVQGTQSSSGYMVQSNVHGPVQCIGPVQGTQSSSRYTVQFKVYGAVQVHGLVQGTQFSSRL